MIRKAIGSFFIQNKYIEETTDGLECIVEGAYNLKDPPEALSPTKQAKIAQEYKKQVWIGSTFELF